MQPTFDCTPEFVTNPPSTPPSTTDGVSITEMPEKDFWEGYGEFNIGDEFYIDDTAEIGFVPQEYRIIGFSGYLVDTPEYTQERVTIHFIGINPNIAATRGQLTYEAFTDALYRDRVLTITNPDYLVDEVESILNPETPTTDADAVFTRDFWEDVIKAKYLLGYLEMPHA